MKKARIVPLFTSFGVGSDVISTKQAPRNSSVILELQPCRDPGPVRAISYFK